MGVFSRLFKKRVITGDDVIVNDFNKRTWSFFGMVGSGVGRSKLNDKLKDMDDEIKELRNKIHFLSKALNMEYVDSEKKDPHYKKKTTKKTNVKTD